MKIEFEKQFGNGVDPWYTKAERWANKQKFPISFLLKGLITFLKQRWIDIKVENTMRGVDADVQRIHEIWDEEKNELYYSQKPSEVKGLDNFEISNNMIEED